MAVCCSVNECVTQSAPVSGHETHTTPGMRLHNQSTAASKLTHHLPDQAAWTCKQAECKPAAMQRQMTASSQSCATRFRRLTRHKEPAVYNHRSTCSLQSEHATQAPMTHLVSQDNPFPTSVYLSTLCHHCALQGVRHDTHTSKRSR